MTSGIKYNILRRLVDERLLGHGRAGSTTADATLALES